MIKRVQLMFEDFVKTESAGGIFLFAAAVLAIVVANTGLEDAQTLSSVFRHAKAAADTGRLREVVVLVYGRAIAAFDGDVDFDSATKAGFATIDNVVYVPGPGAGVVLAGAVLVLLGLAALVTAWTLY